MHESGENYLETILMLKVKKGVVHSIDIARTLNFSKPSVSRAMGILREQGFITMNQSGEIELTEVGLAKANQIYDRHQTLTAFLHDIIGIDEVLAEENACRMEHILDQEVMDGITAFMSHCSRGKCGQDCEEAQ
jgi:Mn-dependent DtxR family transcriptional regulator